MQGIIDWFSQLPGRIWDTLLRAITFVQSWGSSRLGWLYRSREEWATACLLFKGRTEN